MQNHALIVERVLLRNALGRDLVENRFLQQVGAKVLPNLRLSQFWIERTRGPKTNSLADQVIAALRARVTESLCGAPSVSGDHGDEQSDALVACRRRMDERAQSKRQRQDAQR